MLHRAPSDSATPTEYDGFPSIPDWFVNVNPRRILVGIAKPKEKTSGGIYLTDNTRDIDMRLTQLGKVLAVGAMAYPEGFPEENKAKVGDILVFQIYQGLQIGSGKAGGEKGRYRVIDAGMYDLIIKQDGMGDLEFYS